MTNRVIKNTQTSTTNAPGDLDAYVTWFNQTFTFARAEIISGKDGKRMMELRHR